MSSKKVASTIDEEDDIFEYDVSDEDESFYVSSTGAEGEHTLVEYLPKHLEQKLSFSLPLKDSLNTNREIERRIVEVNLEIDSLSLQYDKALEEFEQISMKRMLEEDNMGFDEETKLMDNQEVEFKSPEHEEGDTKQMEDARKQASSIWEQLLNLELRRSNLYGQRNRILLSVAAKVLVSELDKASKDSILREITSLIESARDIRMLDNSRVTGRPQNTDVSVVPQKPQRSVLFNEVVQHMGFNPTAKLAV